MLRRTRALRVVRVAVFTSGVELRPDYPPRVRVGAVRALWETRSWTGRAEGCCACLLEPTLAAEAREVQEDLDYRLLRRVHGRKHRTIVG